MALFVSCQDLVKLTVASLISLVVIVRSLFLVPVRTCKTVFTPQMCAARVDRRRCSHRQFAARCARSLTFLPVSFLLASICILHIDATFVKGYHGEFLGQIVANHFRVSSKMVDSGSE